MPDTSLQSLEQQLPVFTVPHYAVTFCADDPSSYKQVLTIKNPYEFLVKFKISVSTPGWDRYTVTNAQGHIKPNHSVDVIIQHKAVSPANIGLTDKIRVQILGVGPIKVGGKKDLNITLLASANDRPIDEPPEGFRQLEADPSSFGHLKQQPFRPQRDSRNLVIYIVVFVLGIISLGMPNEGDESLYFPDFIPRPTYQFRLIVAYVLGIITVLTLQT